MRRYEKTEILFLVVSDADLLTVSLSGADDGVAAPTGWFVGSVEEVIAP